MATSTQKRRSVIDPPSAPHLAEMIKMPSEVLAHLEAAKRSLKRSFASNTAMVSTLMDDMTDPAAAKASWLALKELCGADQDGWRILYLMLETAATRTAEVYRREGIDQSVFLATMGAFTRFVGESASCYGRLTFDRDFWMWRQLSLSLFRVGTLEYELVAAGHSVADETGFDKVVSVHIPSDASLASEAVDDSLTRWGSFVRQHRPSWGGLPLCCSSWMLSPELVKLLPPTSRILAFQRRFDIVAFHPDTLDWRQWIFDASRLPVASLPENTSLQRAVKRHVLAGGVIGTGVGVLSRR